MLIINGCERFPFRAGYWVEDGYGEVEPNGNKTSPPFNNIFTNKNGNKKAVVVVDLILERLTKGVANEI